jgi:hypothetical protein
MRRSGKLLRQRARGLIPMINPYHLEQRQTLDLIRDHLQTRPEDRERLMEWTAPYRAFRAEVTDFLARYFQEICIEKCFRSRISACCSREGIVTFFADMAVNVLASEEPELDALGAVLDRPNEGFKCVYLGDQGCLWRIKPIVCEMFLCDAALRAAFDDDPEAAARWETLKEERKRYTWPDRPVVFDDLEAHFLAAGRQSPLMYLHNSPGLLRVKQRAGVPVQPMA